MTNKRLKAIWYFGKKYIWLFIIAEICILISYTVSLLLPLNLSMLTDRVLYVRDKELLNTVITNHVIIFTFNTVFNLIYAYTWQTLSNKYVVDIKNKLYEKIMFSKANNFLKMNIGNIMNSIDRDADQFIHIVQRNLFHFINSIILCIGIIVLIATINVVLAIMVVIAAVFPILFTRLNKKYVQNISKKVRNETGEFTNHIFQILKGMREIRFLCAEWWAESKLFSSMKKLIYLNNDITKINFAVNQGADFINTLCILIIYGLSAFYVLDGKITIGFFLAVMQYVALLHKKFNWILQIYLDWNVRKVSIDRVINIIDLESENNLGNNLRGCIKSIEFKNINFKYDNELIIKKASFFINQGDRVAIIGENGTGKTTISKMILRIYEPQSGEILVNNQSINQFKVADVRNNISIVQQNILLLNDTIRYNLVFSNKVEDKKILEVCERVGLKDIIISMPQGLDTRIGNNSMDLSGGQKQRLMIARALLKESSVFIFDEATSALDADTEKIIDEEINRIGKEKTVIIISHKINIIKNCDKIIILQDGYVSDIGTHNELMKKSNIYFNMFNANETGRSANASLLSYVAEVSV